LPALRSQHALPEAGLIVGPGGVLGIIGDLGPAALGLV
jgi:hypothetical protein